MASSKRPITIDKAQFDILKKYLDESLREAVLIDPKTINRSEGMLNSLLEPNSSLRTVKAAEHNRIPGGILTERAEQITRCRAQLNAIEEMVGFIEDDQERERITDWIQAKQEDIRKQNLSYQPLLSVISGIKLGTINSPDQKGYGKYFQDVSAEVSAPVPKKQGPSSSETKEEPKPTKDIFGDPIESSARPQPSSVTPPKLPPLPYLTFEINKLCDEMTMLDREITQMARSEVLQKAAAAKAAAAKAAAAKAAVVEPNAADSQETPVEAKTADATLGEVRPAVTGVKNARPVNKMAGIEEEPEGEEPPEPTQATHAVSSALGTEAEAGEVAAIPAAEVGQELKERVPERGAEKEGDSAIEEQAAAGMVADAERATAVEQAAGETKTSRVTAGWGMHNKDFEIFVRNLFDLQEAITLTTNYSLSPPDPLIAIGDRIKLIFKTLSNSKSTSVEIFDEVCLELARCYDPADPAIKANPLASALKQLHQGLASNEDNFLRSMDWFKSIAERRQAMAQAIKKDSKIAFGNLLFTDLKSKLSISPLNLSSQVLKSSEAAINAAEERTATEQRRAEPQASEGARNQAPEEMVEPAAIAPEEVGVVVDESKFKKATELQREQVEQVAAVRTQVETRTAEEQTRADPVAAATAVPTGEREAEEPVAAMREGVGVSESKLAKREIEPEVMGRIGFHMEKIITALGDKNFESVVYHAAVLNRLINGIDPNVYDVAKLRKELELNIDKDEDAVEFFQKLTTGINRFHAENNDTSMIKDLNDVLFIFKSEKSLKVSIALEKDTEITTKLLALPKNSNDYTIRYHMMNTPIQKIRGELKKDGLLDENVLRDYQIKHAYEIIEQQQKIQPNAAYYLLQQIQQAMIEREWKFEAGSKGTKIDIINPENKEKTPKKFPSEAAKIIQAIERANKKASKEKSPEKKQEIYKKALNEVIKIGNDAAKPKRTSRFFGELKPAVEGPFYAPFKTAYEYKKRKELDMDMKRRATKSNRKGWHS